MATRLKISATLTNILTLGMWNAHVQATVEEDGRRKWVTGDFVAYLSDIPDYPLGQFCWQMNLDQYVAWLAVNRELSKLPYIERIDWPRCEDLR